MPTSYEFRSSARQFREAAAQLRSAPQESSQNMGAEVLWGGRLQASADDVVGRLRSDSDAMALHLERLAEECERRASATDAFAQQWATYEYEYNQYVAGVNAYNADTTGRTVLPTAPLAPATPPAWAEF